MLTEYIRHRSIEYILGHFRPSLISGFKGLPEDAIEELRQGLESLPEKDLLDIMRAGEED